MRLGALIAQIAIGVAAPLSASLLASAAAAQSYPGTQTSLTSGPNPFYQAQTGAGLNPTHTLTLRSGAGPQDRGLAVFQPNGASEAIRVEGGGTGNMMALYAPLYPYQFDSNGQILRSRRPSTMIGNAGNISTQTWVTISGSYLDHGNDAWPGRTHLPASSQGHRGLPYEHRPSMLSVWADVETALELRPWNASNGFLIGFLDRYTGDERAAFDQNGVYWAGPGGRANHDVWFGRVGTRTIGVNGSLRLGSGTLPSPQEAGAGAIRTVLGAGGGATLVFSDGARWYPVQLGAPL